MLRKQAKTISILLAIVLVFACVPFTAMAGTGDPEVFGLRTGGTINPNDPAKRAQAAYTVYAPVFGTNDELWNTAAPFTVGQVLYDFGGGIPATAAARVLWDDNNLYVRVEVTDPSVFMSTNVTPRQMDSVEVMVSERNYKGFNIQNGNPTSGYA